MHRLERTLTPAPTLAPTMTPALPYSYPIPTRTPEPYPYLYPTPSQACIASSYTALSPALQLTFLALSEFPGSFVAAAREP